MAFPKEETDFLQCLCDSILNAAKTVRFAGIVDDAGRLLVGKYRPDIKAPLIKTNAYAEEPKATSFYDAYKILALHLKFRSDLGQMRFQLTEFDKVTLVSIPLNVHNNRYLCISMDGQAQYEVIAKIMNAIG
jgi:hypothetical protein